MAIVPNNLTSQNTPYFRRFGEYRPPSNSTIVENVRDMVSFNLIPRDGGTIINRRVGLLDNYIIDLQVKNVTINTRLQVLLDADNFIKLTQDSYIIEPEEVISVPLELNADYLDLLDIGEYLSNLTVTVVNQNNNIVVARATTPELLQGNTLPDSIDIT